MFDPYKKWLGIPPQDQPPNHYRLLSLQLYEDDLDAIESAVDRVMRFLRQYQSGENAADAVKLLNEVDAARICLLKAASKSAYDAKLRKQLDALKPAKTTDNDAEVAAFRTVGLRSSDLPRLPKRKRTAPTKKVKSKAPSNPLLIPIGIGAGVVVLLIGLMFAFRSPRNAIVLSGDSPQTSVTNTNQQASEPSENSTENTVSAKDEIPIESTAAVEVDSPAATQAETAATISSDPSPTVAASPSATATPTVAESPTAAEQPTPVIAQPAPAKKRRPSNLPMDPSIIFSDYLVEDGKSGEFKFCQTPSLVETSNGLVAAFQAGSAPGAPDVGIWLTRRLKDGKWTTPVEVAGIATDEETDASLIHCLSPVLYSYSPNELVLFYRVGQDPETYRGVVKLSKDHGQTWSKPKVRREGFMGPTKGKPRTLPNRSVIYPCSTENDGWRVHFEFMKGEKWTKTSPINDGRTIQVIEPHLISYQDGSWQAIGRSAKVHGKIFQTWSHDDGKTWSKITFLDLPNPDSSIGVATLSSGRIVLVYNHSSTERTPLNVAFTGDGQKWFAGMTLESDDHESSSPSVIQTKDGMVHIAYGRYQKNIRHLIFDPEKAKRKPFVNGEWPMD